MKLIQGSSRIAFLLFFVSHIPITILIDGQGAFRSYYPQFLIDVVSWYCDLFGDVLMKDNSSNNKNDNDSLVWFSSMICCEILFQLPFFIVAVKMMMRTTHSSASLASSASSFEKKVDDFYPEWFRMSCIIYGSHVSTTLVPIISTFVMSQEMSILQKYATITIYSPYLIFPSWLVWLAVREDFTRQPQKEEKKKASEQQRQQENEIEKLKSSMLNVELKQQDDKNEVIAAIVAMSTSLVLPIVMMDLDEE